MCSCTFLFPICRVTRGKEAISDYCDGPGPLRMRRPGGVGGSGPSNREAPSHSKHAFFSPHMAPIGVAVPAAAHPPQSYKPDYEIDERQHHVGCSPNLSMMALIGLMTDRGLACLSVTR